MFELRAENAAEYLGYPCSAVELGGGVSNTVILIEAPGKRFVLKQSLAKLRVQQDWFSDRARIFRESSAMRQLTGMLPPGSVPDILFEDRDNFLFAMSAAPSHAMPWKDALLQGQIDDTVAEQIGLLLSEMIAGSWNSAAFEEEFGDQTIFDELRLDPYYRTTASRNPDLARQFQDLMDNSAGRRVSLVHGDWSPKNFLVWKGRVMAIDFEVVHFGDPSFDAAFLLNHLLLKMFNRPELRDAYQAAAVRFWVAITVPSDWFEAATIAHLGALLLSRVDGKSPAEYIRRPGLKANIRSFARDLITQPMVEVQDVFKRASEIVVLAQ